MGYFYFDLCEGGRWLTDDEGSELLSAAKATEEAEQTLLARAGDKSRKGPLAYPFRMKIRVRERGTAKTQELSLAMDHAVA